eukprot:9497118-Pyramimonas_sp.AAC.1
MLGPRLPRSLGAAAAFADDLGVDTADVIAALRVGLPVLQLAERVAGMQLNLPKCVLVVVKGISRCEFDQLFLESGLVIPGIVSGVPGKYLGVWVGQDSGALSWQAPASKALRRARKCKALKLGLVKTVLRYNACAFSCMGYVAQFFAPSKYARQQEYRALQSLTDAPRKSMSRALLYDLKNGGLRVQAHHLM